MQEPHVEDVANHNDPESCGVYREVHVEALTGGSAGQPLSFEIHLRGADRVVLTGRHYWHVNSRNSCRKVPDILAGCRRVSRAGFGASGRATLGR